MFANKFALSQIQLGILVLVTTPAKFRNFFPLLSLERAFPAHKLTENYYLNMNISFFWRNGNLIVNWVPSFFHKHSAPERQSHDLAKWNHWDLKNPNFLTFIELGEIWKCNLWSFTKYLRLTLVFMWNNALRQRV